MINQASDVHSLLLAAHVISGSLGLLSGTVSMLRRKSGKGHRVIGRIFLYAMTFSALLAVALFYYGRNLFLLSTGVFTLYLVLSAYRALLQYRNKEDASGTRIDRLLSAGMLVFSLLLTGLALLFFYQGSPFGLVPLSFAAIGINGVRGDFLRFRYPPEDRLVWLRVHLGRMTGAYMAALTAFLVNNIYRLGLPGPAVLWWSLPGLLLTPVLFRWLRKYRRPSVN